MKTDPLTIVRYSPPSDDGHPAVLVVAVNVAAEFVLEGERAERLKAQIEAGESAK